MNNNELIQGYVELIIDGISDSWQLPQEEMEETTFYKKHIQLVEKFSGKSWKELKNTTLTNNNNNGNIEV